MKITRRSDTGTGGHLLISVPAGRVAEVEAALTFLEEKYQQRGSQTDMPMGPDQRWIEVAPPGAQTLSFTRFCGCYAGSENDKQIHSGPSAFENTVK